MIPARTPHTPPPPSSALAPASGGDVRAAADLQTVIDRWGDLADMVGTPATLTWPPAGIAAYMAALDELDGESLEALRQARADEKADRAGEDLGDRPTPVRLRVLDAQHAVGSALSELADQLASEVQRPAASRVRAAGPGDRVGLALSTATVQDQADRRRWSWTDTRTREAPWAAAWLLARLEDAPGPFARLTGEQRDRIARVAAGAAERILAALEEARRARTVSLPCPAPCGGRLEVHGGDGRDPSVTCTECGRTWTGPHTTGPGAAA